MDSDDTVTSDDLPVAVILDALHELSVDSISTTDSNMAPSNFQPAPHIYTVFTKDDGTQRLWFADDSTFFPIAAENTLKKPSCHMIQKGVMLGTQFIDPIMRAQRDMFPAVSSPIDLIYMPAAGIPSLNKSEKLKDSRSFKPSIHQIIVRIVHSENPLHWTLLMHFIKTRTVIIWDCMDDGQGNLERFTHHDNKLIEHHRYWTKGTIAEAPKRGWNVLPVGHGVQMDNWSCGLWCLARIDDLYRELNSILAHNEYEKRWELIVRELLQKTRIPVREIDLKRANKLLFQAQLLGYEVKGCE